MFEDLQKIDYEIVVGKQGKYRGKNISDAIFCFDIEDTSYYINEYNEPVMFDYKDPDKFINYKKGALCYHWQLSINGSVFLGRELTEFKKLIIKLNEYCPARKIIYVHFLSHEFQFLLNIFKFDDVFARNTHKPLTAYIEKYNVEFRCSYMLTRLSLDSWSKKLPVKKLKGDLDYDIMRTPLTKLTDKETEYCINDVLVMHYGIKNYKEKYEHIYNIPLTQTGEVRREVKKRLSKNRNWLCNCKSLLPENLQKFKELLNAFIGGTVISNTLYKNTTVSNVLMYDIASSYPWVMISERYPIKPFKEIPIEKFEKRYRNNPLYCYLITFVAYNIKSKTNCKFLSKSKTIYSKNTECDNGRIIRSAELKVTLTNLDYELFNKCYNYEKIEIESVKVSENNYLPDEFRKYIIELYNNKTTLKGVMNMEDLYMVSKQFINSLFGLMVTKDFSDDILFNQNDYTWDKKELSEMTFIEKLEIKKKSLSKNFLSFQFGVWVTAYARNNLWKGILALDDYVVYCDTDSIKYINEEPTNFFIDYNKDIMNKHKYICKQLNIPLAKLSPLNPQNKACSIGVFECENPDNMPIDEFKTMGAKKYIYRDPKTKELKMTVAGISKEAVKCLNNNIENFNINKTFTEYELKKAGCSKLTPYYLNDIDEIKMPDGYINKYKYGICLMPTTYNLNISPSDLLLLAQLMYDKDCNLLKVRSTELERI